MKARHRAQCERTFKRYSALAGTDINYSGWEELEDFSLAGNNAPESLVISDFFTEGFRKTSYQNRIRRCAMFLANLSDHHPAPRPKLVTATTPISEGHGAVIRTGIGDYFFGIQDTPAGATLHIHSTGMQGKGRFTDAVTGHDAYVPRSSLYSTAITLEPGQLVVLRGSAEHAETAADEKFKKSTLPHSLEIPEGESIEAITAYAQLRESAAVYTHTYAHRHGFRHYL